MSLKISIALLACLLVCCQGAQHGPSPEGESSSSDSTFLPQTASAPAIGSGEISADPSDDAAVLFDQTKVLTYDLSISPLDLAAINALPAAEQYVPATLSVNGEKVKVAVRYKGSVGAFLSPCTLQAVPVAGAPLLPKTGKCSMKIAFDEYDDEARFHGLKKINLHAMGHDSSLMKERLGYALFREMGIAAPRAVHARVTINGKLEGVFLAVEEVDGRFARSRFREGGKGNIYKEAWPIDDDPDYYRDALEANKGDDTNVDKMLAFERALRESPARAVATFLDRAYMLAYIAVDRGILNDDGFLHWYCFSNHNYFWYEAVNSNRMWLIPWDLDDAFATDSSNVALKVEWDAIANTCGACGMGENGFGDLANELGDIAAQRAPTCDPLTRQLASWTSEYDATVRRFLEGPYAASNVNAKLERWAKQIEALVDEAEGVRGAGDVSSWRRGIEKLRATIAEARLRRGR